MTYSTGFAILTSAFPAGERGKVLGINIAATYSGLSIGPFLGGLLTQHFGWRSIFIASIPFCLVILYLAFWKMKEEWIETKGEKFDLTGSVIYSLALASIMYGLTLLPDKTGIGLVLIGVLGILIFIRWESRAESPVLELDLFRKNRLFAFSNLAALVHYSGYICRHLPVKPVPAIHQGADPSVSGTRPCLSADCPDCFFSFCGMAFRSNSTENRCLHRNVSHCRRNLPSRLFE